MYIRQIACTIINAQKTQLSNKKQHFSIDLMLSIAFIEQKEKMGIKKPEKIETLRNITRMETLKPGTPIFFLRCTF